MGINKNDEFIKRDIYIDYPFEEVMFRWNHKEKKFYRKFYGETEYGKTIPAENRLLNDAMRFGEEIDMREYKDGKNTNA